MQLKLLFTPLLILLAFNVFGAKKLVITESFECEYVGKYSYLLEDSSHQITIQELLFKPFNEWEDNQLEKPRKGVSGSMFWSKTTIENTTSQAQTITIVLEYPMVDWVQFFMVDEEKDLIDQSAAMGDIQPFRRVTIAHH